MESAVKTSWAYRIQPWVGAALVALAGVVLIAAYEVGASDANVLERVAPAGFMAFAGLGMVFRARGRKRWLLLLGAVGVAALGRAVL